MTSITKWSFLLDLLLDLHGSTHVLVVHMLSIVVTRVVNKHTLWVEAIVEVVTVCGSQHPLTACILFSAYDATATSKYGKVLVNGSINWLILEMSNLEILGVSHELGFVISFALLYILISIIIYKINRLRLLLAYLLIRTHFKEIWIQIWLDILIWVSLWIIKQTYYRLFTKLSIILLS
jgi:hypothetical protein